MKDVAVVLGNTFRTERSIESMRLRTQKAAELWRQGACRRLILSGGYKTRKDISEAAFMASIARELGVPETNLIKEEHSNTTIGNAVWTKRIMDENNFSSAIVVTSPHHLLRTRYIFTRIMPEKDLEFISSKNNLSFKNIIAVYYHELHHMAHLIIRGINLERI